MASGLTEQQKAFCEYYVLFLNGARAAHKAEYGKDRTTARYRARDLLKDPKIQAYIAELREEWKERIGVTTERVLKELAAIAFSDMGKLVKWNDQIAYLKDSDELTRRQRAAVAEVRNEYYGGSDDSEAKGTVKLKLHSKTEALKLLGTHLGAFTDKSEVEHSGGITVTVKRLTNAKAK